jgi:chromosome segregation ATPase
MKQVTNNLDTANNRLQDQKEAIEKLTTEANTLRSRQEIDATTISKLNGELHTKETLYNAEVKKLTLANKQLMNTTDHQATTEQQNIASTTRQIGEAKTKLEELAALQDENKFILEAYNKASLVIQQLDTAHTGDKIISKYRQDMDKQVNTLTKELQKLTTDNPRVTNRK